MMSSMDSSTDDKSEWTIRRRGLTTARLLLSQCFTVVNRHLNRATLIKESI